MKFSVSLVLLVFVSSIGLRADAQKLPNVQQKSLRAPAIVKIDGKLNEWDDTFQAYNHTNDIYYTVCNDDEYLYLIIRALEVTSIRKITGAGFTFAVDKSRRRSTSGGVAITYPLMGPLTIQAKKQDPSLSAGEADSLMKIHNRVLDAKSKQIKVNGIAGMDSLISVYNEQGIKVAQRFDEKGAYDLELAVSLKNLGMSPSTQSKFSYNIKLNQVKVGVIDSAPGFTITRDANGVISSVKIADGARAPSPGDWAATDFWGEYTLAKN